MANVDDPEGAVRREHLIRSDNISFSVHTIKKFVDAFDPSRHKDQVSIRLERLEHFYVQYVEEIVQLQLLPPASPEIDYNERLENFEAQYYELKTQLTQLLPKRVQVPQKSNPLPLPQINHIKFPEIKLPEFSGNPLDWRSFHDRFNAAVHSSDELCPSEKFQYLKGLLRGEASGLISEIPISDENYSEAWKRLIARYDDKRILVKCHLAELFDTSPMKCESAESLLNLVDRFDRNVSILKKLGEPTDSWSSLLVFQLSNRLEPNTLREWENHIARATMANHDLSEMPLYSEMIVFLQNHARVLQALVPAPSRNREPRIKLQPKFSTLHVAQDSHPSYSTGRSCLQCGSDHYLYQCFKFRKLSPKQRFDFVKQHRLCLNCLKTSAHGCRDCSSDGCRKCRKRHHTLIHLQPIEQKPENSNPSENQQHRAQPSTNPPFAPRTQSPSRIASTSSTSLVSVDQFETPDSLASTSSQPPTTPHQAFTAHSAKLPTDIVLLSTALVYIEDCAGEKFTARVLLDSCSQFNLMTESFYQKLKLPIEKDHVKLGGVGQHVTSVNRSVKSIVSSRVSALSWQLKFLVLPTISHDQPSHPLMTTDWEIPSWITLADPTFCTPAAVDALLGADVFFQLLRYGKITIGDHLPILQNTVLGWIVSGRCSSRSSEVEIQRCHLTHNQRLEQLVNRFWALEECGSKTCWSPSEKLCEQHFVENVSRNTDGRYVVRLPMKKELLPRLRDNRFNAQRRFFALERKLDANLTLRKQYEDFINEFLELGHMRQIAPSELSKENESLPRYFLPHHAVLRPESSTTKLRTVFDASCKSCSGLSLNDVLLAGPTIQDTLLSIVLRFRMHAYVVTGDIAKMYRQVLVHDEDQPLQRIFWRSRKSEELKTYQLLTVTYGTNCAPFLATRVLQQLAEDERSRYPLAAPVVIKDLYMDDLLTGQDDLEQLKKICTELLSIFSSAGMDLRKISSNSQQILNVVPEECRETKTLIEFDSESPIKTLGLLWEPATDSILYKRPNFTRHKFYTKRIILSQTASFFDPLGLLGPAIVKAKIIIQTLWKLNFDWDYRLPENFTLEWEEYQSQFHRLKNFTIPRHVKSLCRPACVQMHGFSDASEHAYGACVYLRSVAPDGYVTIRLLAAKSRVAPVNTKSIARLELCGALLLSRLLLMVCDSIGLQDNIFLWTDSTIVLHWLSASPSSWQTFVGNRVAEIQELTAHCSWHHVPGTENPADLISRGLDIGDLIDSSLWWNGPPWLAEANQPWPEAPESFDNIKEKHLEARKGLVLSIANSSETDLIENFSSFTHLLRIAALCRRFFAKIRYCRQVRKSLPHPTEPPPPGPITVDELNETLLAIVRRVQEQTFGQEFAALRSEKPLPSSSPLRYLAPKLCGDLIRVGGRLSYASISSEAKNPLVLPRNHYLSRLIAETMHRDQLHCGPQFLLATLRQRFWPLGGRNLVRNVVHGCVTCVKARPRSLSQQMGQLPAVRVTQSYAFENVGIDFAGPFYLKRPSPRSAPVKSYVAVFICMATKAVHLELVSDLTSASFIACLRRFVGRRGRPANIFCDNATNFVGADRELRNLFRSTEHRHAVVNETADQLVRFNFIPPRSPSFGGLWESCVKIMKHHLRRIIGNAFLSYEAFITVLAQVEACLNSRPITPLTSDPNDMRVLTPGHFITGRPLNALPERDVTNAPEGLLHRWEKVQQQTQHFWQRWHHEYLTSLQQRYKWSTKTSNLINGAMVLLRDDILPIMKWPMGRVVAVHPGSDGLVRVATIKLPNGSTTKRAISKLCVLPIEVDPAALEHLLPEVNEVQNSTESTGDSGDIENEEESVET